MDVTQVQSSANYQALSTPAASPKTGAATDVSNTVRAAATVTAKTSGLLALNAGASAATNAEIDKYVADLKSGQSLTVIYGLQQNTTLKVTNLGSADLSGLISGPGGILYRPGVVNSYPTLPSSTPEVHNINWGGYGSIQATPQPTQIVPYDPANSIGPTVDAGEILIVPAQDASTRQSAQASLETVFTPAAPAIPLTGPVIVASRSNLVPSTDPLAAGNVEFGRGLQPPSSVFLYGPNPNPSPTSSTPPQTGFVGKTTTAIAAGTVTIEHLPIVNSIEASIVTVNSDGTTTVDENSATTTANNLSKYTKGFLSRLTVDANGTITAYSGQAGSSKSDSAWQTKLDVTA